MENFKIAQLDSVTQDPAERKEGADGSGIVGELVRLFAENQDQADAKKNGVVRPRPGSPNWHVDFYYFSIRVVLSSGYAATQENFAIVRKFLDEVVSSAKAGSLIFAEKFPFAPERLKAQFAKMEGREYTREPHTITFGIYWKDWDRTVLEPQHSEGKKRDYRKMMALWILPYCSALTFAEMNGVCLKRFISQLLHARGKKKGTQLSASTIRNILVVLRAIWYDALEEFGWDLRDPFLYVSRRGSQSIIPSRNVEPPDVFRFEEMAKLLAVMRPFYRPVTEFMILTGMSASEIAALRPSDVRDGFIHVERSYLYGVESEKLKTRYRKRKIPLTVAISAILAQLKPKGRNGVYFLHNDGDRFDSDYYRDGPWDSAMAKSKLRYRKPYTTRHTFAAWSLILGVHPEKLVRLMGHGNKTMVYETYGKYVEDLERDGEQIRRYFGSDFK